MDITQNNVGITDPIEMTTATITLTETTKTIIPETGGMTTTIVEDVTTVEKKDILQEIVEVETTDLTMITTVQKTRDSTSRG